MLDGGIGLSWIITSTTATLAAVQQFVKYAFLLKRALGSSKDFVFRFLCTLESLFLLFLLLEPLEMILF